MTHKLLLFFIFILTLSKAYAVEWILHVEKANSMDRLIRYDQYGDRGLRTVDSIPDHTFIGVKGRVTTKQVGDGKETIKAKMDDIAVLEGNNAYPISGNQWSRKDFSKGISYFNLYNQDKTYHFYWIFVIPKNSKPTQLRVFDKTAPLPLEKSPIKAPAKTAQFTVISTNFVEQLIDDDYYIQGIENGKTKRVDAVRSMTAVHGKLLGVTLEATATQGRHKDPIRWSYTFRDVGIVVNGAWSSSVTQASPSGKGFTASGGGISSSKFTGNWEAGKATFFFVVPDQIDTFTITLCGDPVTSGKAPQK
jgi:hypothetical protein